MNNLGKSKDVPDIKGQATILKELNSSDKSFVALGERNNNKVIIKKLLSEEDIWREKFYHEIYVHELFNESSPPFKAAKSLFSDNELLILEYTEGEEIIHDRYPEYDIANQTINRVIELSNQISLWVCPNKDKLRTWDYHKKLQKYTDKGFFSEIEKKKLNSLLSEAEELLEFNHGDLLLSNIIQTPNGTCVPIDWEFAGLFLPGFDLALLHSILVENKYARQVIEKHVISKGIYIPFIINKAFVLVREIKMHEELPDNLSFKHKRLSLLNAEWDIYRNKLKEV